MLSLLDTIGESILKIAIITFNKKGPLLIWRFWNLFKEICDN